MAVSEEDVKEEETITEDFRKAKQIMERIKKDPEIFTGMMPDMQPILFALCLIYMRQLKHHRYEENVSK
jgi:hypothetical protein